MQIRARRRERQVEKHSLGLAQNLGGSGATAVARSWGRMTFGTVYTGDVVHAPPEQYAAGLRTSW